jgi:hypothetical protein
MGQFDEYLFIVPAFANCGYFLPYQNTPGKMHIRNIIRFKPAGCG